MTTSSIPASAIVNVVPSVVSAGGSALDLSGLILTANTRVPIGAVPSFPSLASVSAYFGPTATETALAGIYFSGFDASTVKPGALLFSQYVWSTPVAAYLRGGSVAALTLTQLQSLAGTLSLTVNGTSETSSNISLTGATSFSNAATIIQAAFTSPPFTVTYDSISGGFVFTSSTTGATSTITFAAGTLAAGLNLTQATGAVLSQGAADSTPAAAMSAITAVTQNWASFMTAFEPVTADKEAFAAWNNSQGNRYVYAMWDSNVLNTEVGGGSPAVSAINAAAYSGTAMLYANPAVDTTGQIAAFLMGAIASLDFSATAGRATMAFRTQSGLTPSVTSQTAASYLLSYGMSFYGSYATANDAFTFFNNGSITGPFKWADSYVNQIWMNNQFQLALMVLLQAANSIPYNQAGYSLIEAACADVISQALNFGAIQPGVTLSAAQAAEVNTAAGVKIDTTLNQRGWYLQVLDATPQVRAARGTPPCNFWYMDGGSVQQITLASIEIQ